MNNKEEDDENFDVELRLRMDAMHLRLEEVAKINLQAWIDRINLDDITQTFIERVFEYNYGFYLFLQKFKNTNDDVNTLIKLRIIDIQNSDQINYDHYSGQTTNNQTTAEFETMDQMYALIPEIHRRLDLLESIYKPIYIHRPRTEAELDNMQAELDQQNQRRQIREQRHQLRQEKEEQQQQQRHQQRQHQQHQQQQSPSPSPLISPSPSPLTSQCSASSLSPSAPPPHEDPAIFNEEFDEYLVGLLDYDLAGAVKLFYDEGCAYEIAGIIVDIAKSITPYEILSVIDIYCIDADVTRYISDRSSRLRDVVTYLELKKIIIPLTNNISDEIIIEHCSKSDTLFSLRNNIYRLSTKFQLVENYWLHKNDLYAPFEQYINNYDGDYEHDQKQFNKLRTTFNSIDKSDKTTYEYLSLVELLKPLVVKLYPYLYEYDKQHQNIQYVNNFILPENKFYAGTIPGNYDNQQQHDDDSDTSDVANMDLDLDKYNKQKLVANVDVNVNVVVDDDDDDDAYGSDEDEAIPTTDDDDDSFNFEMVAEALQLLPFQDDNVQQIGSAERPSVQDYNKKPRKSLEMMKPFALLALTVLLEAEMLIAPCARSDRNNTNAKNEHLEDYVDRVLVGGSSLYSAFNGPKQKIGQTANLSNRKSLGYKEKDFLYAITRFNLLKTEDDIKLRNICLDFINKFAEETNGLHPYHRQFWKTIKDGIGDFGIVKGLCRLLCEAGASFEFGLFNPMEVCMFEEQCIKERIDILEDGINQHMPYIDRLKAKAIDVGVEIEVQVVSSWKPASRHTMDAITVIIHAYIGAVWSDTIDFAAVPDGTTAAHIFSKEYTPAELHAGLQVFVRWIKRAKTILMYLILDMNVLVTGSEKNSHKLIRYFGFELKAICFKKEIYVYVHPISGSLIHLHFPLSIAACAKIESGDSDARVGLSLMRFITVEFFNVCVSIINDDEYDFPTNILEYKSIVAGCGYEMIGTIFKTNKFIRALIAKLLMTTDFEGVLERTNLKKTPTSGLFAHARNKYNNKHSAGSKEVDDSIILRLLAIVSSVGHEWKYLNRDTLTLDEAVTIIDQKLILLDVDVSRNNKNKNNRWKLLLNNLKKTSQIKNDVTSIRNPTRHNHGNLTATNPSNELIESNDIIFSKIFNIPVEFLQLNNTNTTINAYSSNEEFYLFDTPPNQLFFNEQVRNGMYKNKCIFAVLFETTKSRVKKEIKKTSTKAKKGLRYKFIDNVSAGSRIKCRTLMIGKSKGIISGTGITEKFNKKYCEIPKTQLIIRLCYLVEEHKTPCFCVKCKAI